MTVELHREIEKVTSRFKIFKVHSYERQTTPLVRDRSGVLIGIEPRLPSHIVTWDNQGQTEKVLMQVDSPDSVVIRPLIKRDGTTQTGDAVKLVEDEINKAVIDTVPENDKDVSYAVLWRKTKPKDPQF